MRLRLVPEPEELRSSAVVTLVAVNLLPLVGVLWLGWDLGLVILLFWFENVVIGSFAILRMALTVGWIALFAVPFFTVHFGMFCLGHLIFVLLFFVVEDPFTATPSDVVEATGFASPGVWVVLAGLVLSHGISFVRNFIGRDEREAAHVQSLMVAPYKRVFVMHLTVMAGGFLVLGLGAPTAALVVLVLLKTAVDLVSHVHEHRTAAPAEDAHPTSP